MYSCTLLLTVAVPEYDPVSVLKVKPVGRGGVILYVIVPNPPVALTGFFPG